MDPTNPSKAEEVASKKKSRKRTIIISVALVVLVLLVVGIVTGTLVSRRNNRRSGGRPPAAAVTTICSLTQHRDECIATLSSANTSDPVRIFRFSLSVALGALRSLNNFPNDYSSRHGDASRVRDALGVCGTVLNHSIETLNDTVTAMDIRNGQNLLTPQRIEDLRTWLSTVITNQQTCLDALEEVNATFVDEIRQLTRNATVFTSNSLAIVSRIVGALTEVRIPTNRRLLSSNDGFPSWLSTGDRRLLQSTRPTPNVVVARDGSGDVTTIAAAVQRIPRNSNSRFVIYVRAGVYVENVQIPSNLWNVMIYGDSSTTTTISGSLNFVDGTPTFQTATVAVVGQSFMARDIGFRNSAGAAKHQAVALRSGSDLSVFYRCYFDGFQDTLYTHSNRQFYRECTITGTIDFIFGNSAVVFQNCNIRPRQPMSNQFNTITAQGKTDPNQNTGISIQRAVVSPLNTVTAQTYLGRPWQPYSTTVFMQSNLGGFINSQGWTPWTPGVIPPGTIFYGEYQNTGAGAGTGSRVNWPGVHSSLTASQASQYNVANFIRGGNWLPATGVAFDST